MRNALVTGCDARFADGAAVLLRGFRQHHPDIRRFCITPASDAAEVGRKLGGLAEIFPIPRSIDVGEERMPPALLKLFTPLVDADVAVWADCDMVLCRPASELWEVRPKEVVAVLDTAYKIRFMIDPKLFPLFEKQFPASVEGQGFNSGLFGLRTDEWRDLPERYEAAFAAGGYSFHPKIWDQPFLNGLMQPNVRYLPHEFNAHNVFNYPIPRDVRIVHFTAATKPWMARYPKHQPAYYYWLRYGLGEERFWPLAKAKLRIWARNPIRVASLYLRARGLR